MASETAEKQEGTVREAGASVLFAGSYPGKLDAKGRVILPPAFRQKLAGEVFAFPSLVEPVIQIGDAGLHRLVLRAVKGLDVIDDLDRRLTNLQNAILQRLQPVHVDDAGRVTVTDAMRRHAGLDGPLGFAGRGEHFVLAAAGYLERIEAEALSLAGEVADTLAALMRPQLPGGGR